MGIRLFTQMFIVVCLTVVPAAGQGGAEDGFRPLFDGKTLAGWVQVNTAPSTWTIQDGLLVCSGKPIGEIRTDRMYQNFIMEVEWRHMVPKGNAGIFIWADDITARGQPFHRGIEVQVLENAYGDGPGHTTHGDIFPIHGATMIPVNGRGGARSGRAFPTEKLAKPSPQWNHYRIECRDGEISLAVNGKQVTRGTNSSPRKGYICLESEGGIVHYRNIRIKELPDTPIAPEHIAIPNRGFRSLYNGIDLTGWNTDAKARQLWQARDWVLKFEDSISPMDGSMATDEMFCDYGLIIDFRFTKESRKLSIELRDDEEGIVQLVPNDAALSKLFVSSGQWNRLEGTLQANMLSVSLNGQSWFSRQVATAPGGYPIRIVPSGSVDLANIYVRQLD